MALTNFFNLSNSSKTVPSKGTSRKLSSVLANWSFRAVLSFLNFWNSALELKLPPQLAATNFSPRVFDAQFTESRVFLKRATGGRWENAGDKGRQDISVLDETLPGGGLWYGSTNLN